MIRVTNKFFEYAEYLTMSWVLFQILWSKRPNEHIALMRGIIEHRNRHYSFYSGSNTNLSSIGFLFMVVLSSTPYLDPVAPPGVIGVRRSSAPTYSLFAHRCDRRATRGKPDKTRWYPTSSHSVKQEDRAWNETLFHIFIDICFLLRNDRVIH